MTEPQPPRDPLRMFTFAGRLLALATMLVAGGVFYWFVMFVNDKLPSGRYPIPFLLIPVVIGAAVFFIVIAFLLGLVGIRICKKQNDDDNYA